MRSIASCSVLFLGIVVSACSSDDSPATQSGPSSVGGAPSAGAANVAGAPSAGAPSAGAANVAGAPSAGAPAGGSAGSANGGANAAGTSGSAGLGGAGAWPVGDPGSDGDGIQTVTNMTKQTELTDLKNPKGKEFTFKLTSKSYQYTEKTIAAGSPKNQPRSVWVYVPNAYKDGDEASFMIINDGQQGGRYTDIKFALDNLTISTNPARKLPPFIAIAVQDGGGDGPNNERGLEYDTISDRYGLFVQNEVIPAVKNLTELRAAFPNFKLTDNPEGRATFGCSSGGAAALTMAWFHPELFRRVVTYSGTFVSLQNSALPEHDQYPDGAWDYHHDKNLIANADKKPLRIFNNANEHDNGYNTAESGKRNWLIANQATHAALEAKGYHNKYVYGVGVGHCDDGLRRATLADALVWVWRGYPAQ